MRFSAVIVVLLVALTCVGPAAAAQTVAAGAWLVPAHHPDDDEDPLPEDTGDSLREVAEIPFGAGRIIGTPETGPAPQRSGDRGGGLQLATLGVLCAAVSLIAWRITSNVRRVRRNVPTATNPD